MFLLDQDHSNTNFDIKIKTLLLHHHRDQAMKHLPTIQGWPTGIKKRPSPNKGRQNEIPTYSCPEVTDPFSRTSEGFCETETTSRHRGSVNKNNENGQGFYTSIREDGSHIYSHLYGTEMQHRKGEPLFNSRSNVIEVLNLTWVLKTWDFPTYRVSNFLTSNL